MCVRNHCHATGKRTLTLNFDWGFLTQLSVAENKLGTEKAQKINRRMLTFMITPMANIMVASADPP